MTAACIDVALDWHEPADYPRAAAICAGCSERAGCEAGARARGEQWGMFGGVVFDLDATDGFLLAEMPEPAAVEVVHGKRSTYTSGKCTSCPKCLAANARYRSAWLAKQGDVTETEASTAEQLDLFGRTA